MQLLRTPGGIQAPSWRFALGRAVWTRSQRVPPACKRVIQVPHKASSLWAPSEPLWALQQVILLPITFLGISLMYFKLKDCTGLCGALPGPSPWAEDQRNQPCPHHVVGLLHSVPGIAKKAFTVISNTLRCQQPEHEVILAPHWIMKTILVSQQQTMI